jgi:hypothetical protein
MSSLRHRVAIPCDSQWMIYSGDFDLKFIHGIEALLPLSDLRQ